MKVKRLSYAVVTLERPEDKPETMGNVDRIEKVDGYDADENFIQTYNELSYDGSEFPEGVDPREYVAEKLGIPIEKVYFDY